MLQNATPEHVFNPLNSMYDFVLAGGPLMWPLGVCSLIALAYIFERSLNLSKAKLGRRAQGEQWIDTVKTNGPGRALELVSTSNTALARVFAAGLRRAGAPLAEVEKAVEDAGSREVRRMTSHLRPLMVVITVAPLLGLLGTAWGMIVAFIQIASAHGLGRPEQLADGISQKLVTTMTGLAIAIITITAYHWFKSRIDGFARQAEDLFERLADALRARGTADAHP